MSNLPKAQMDKTTRERIDEIPSKYQPQVDKFKESVAHASDCAVHNPPAYDAEDCDCGAAKTP